MQYIHHVVARVIPWAKTDERDKILARWAEDVKAMHLTFEPGLQWSTEQFHGQLFC